MMFKIKMLISTVVFLGVVCPAMLYAQASFGDPGSKEYVSAKIGKYMPGSADLDKLNAEDDFSGQLGFGYYLTDYFAVESSFGYFQTNGNINNMDVNVEVFPFEIAGRLCFPVGGLEPYVTAGIGGYYVKADVTHIEVDSTQIGFFGGGGIKLNLGDRFFIGAEAKWLYLEASSPNPYYHNTSMDLDLDGVTVMGMIGFYF
jgi:opacity protein-like surface antigen